MSSRRRRVWTAAALAVVAATVAALAYLVFPGNPTHLPAKALAGFKSTITYCTLDGVQETMDVYEPYRTPARPVPAVVYVHGGGWVFGFSIITADSVEGQIEAGIVQHGWVFVSLNYRLAPQYRWPAQIQDVACAIRSIRAHAAGLHVDPLHIGAIGGSAGGQLVSLLGLAPDISASAGAPYAGASSALQAVVDEFGPEDLTASDWRSSTLSAGIEREEFGMALGTDTPELRAASPVTYVAPGAPPFLVIQGDRDDVVPPSQSTELVRRLRAAGDTATLIVVRNAGHAYAPAGAGPIHPTLLQIEKDAVLFLFNTL